MPLFLPACTHSHCRLSANIYPSISSGEDFTLRRHGGAGRAYAAADAVQTQPSGQHAPTATTSETFVKLCMEMDALEPAHEDYVLQRLSAVLRQHQEGANTWHLDQTARLCANAVAMKALTARTAALALIQSTRFVAALWRKICTQICQQDLSAQSGATTRCTFPPSTPPLSPATYTAADKREIIFAILSKFQPERGQAPPQEYIQCGLLASGR